MDKLTQSSVSYSPTVVPQGVSEKAKRALKPFDPLWSTGVPEGHREHGNNPGVLVQREQWFDVFRALKELAGFVFLIDHTAVDYPDRQPERFTVVGIVMNPKTQERLLVKTRVAEGDAVASLTPLWNSANWAERETYDMFGIPFEGHPELTRIYMPEDYEGWPMRRDFPLQGHLRFQD